MRDVRATNDPTPWLATFTGGRAAERPNEAGWEYKPRPAFNAQPVVDAEVPAADSDATLKEIASELNGLMDSLDDHVTHDDIHEALRQLWIRAGGAS